MPRAGQFKKGNPGKPKGATTKITRAVRETVINVFDKLQEHPEANLYNTALENPMEFYKYLAAKIIPTEIAGTLTNVFRVTRGKLPELTDDNDNGDKD